ncbi:hypothetical protein AAFF_G00207770 [Aldrovandia affinis]|uniref:Uncharacterized protein n=1 Tax=Aldrovandia affinis TaxID=143900 RepID=A0AAD7VWV2_9TELE|nr:hypothetical protein AAFF_G00207770 [Aldrovandia affinis]
MDSHHLKLNPGKTELIFIPALNSPHLDFSISLGDTLVTSSPCAKNLGVVMDNRLSLSMNIAAPTQALRGALHRHEPWRQRGRRPGPRPAAGQ